MVGKCISSIQMLKGPQGTLFGRNATGGELVITTADPDLGLHGKGKLSGSRFNTARGDLT